MVWYGGNPIYFRYHSHTAPSLSLDIISSWICKDLLATVYNRLLLVCLVDLLDERCPPLVLIQDTLATRLALRLGASRWMSDLRLMAYWPLMFNLILLVARLRCARRQTHLLLCQFGLLVVLGLCFAHQHRRSLCHLPLI